MFQNNKFQSHSKTHPIKKLCLNFPSFNYFALSTSNMKSKTKSCRVAQLQMTKWCIAQVNCKNPANRHFLSCDVPFSATEKSGKMPTNWVPRFPKLSPNFTLSPTFFHVQEKSRKARTRWLFTYGGYFVILRSAGKMQKSQREKPSTATSSSSLSPSRTKVNRATLCEPNVRWTFVQGRTRPYPTSRKSPTTAASHVGILFWNECDMLGP